MCQRNYITPILAALQAHLILPSLMMFALLLLPHEASAVGTTAGAPVSNQATVSFSTPFGGNFTQTSNLANFRVDEIVRLNVVWQDASTATVVPGSLNQYITLVLTNTGNGTESIILSTTTLLGGDQFDPVSAGFFLDSNSNGIYEPAIDLASADTIVLSADEATRVFVVNNIPSTRSDSTPLQDGDIGLFNVSVSSGHGNGASGTVFPGAGDNGGTAIFGQDFPMTDIGQYEVQAADVAILKTAVIQDPDGGNQVQPGATITYALTVSITGVGAAYGLVVSDPIPVDTTYVSHSLTLDGAPMSDIADGDAGETSGTPVNLITVDLGDQEAGNHSISFKVTIDE